MNILDCITKNQTFVKGSCVLLTSCCLPVSYLVLQTTSGIRTSKLDIIIFVRSEFTIHNNPVILSYTFYVTVKKIKIKTNKIADLSSGKHYRPQATPKYFCAFPDSLKYQCIFWYTSFKSCVVPTPIS